jgi:uncharacterized protein
MSSPSGLPARPSPIADAERIDALDAIRGVAIRVVLLAYTVWSLGSPPTETWSAADRWVAQAGDRFVDTKFLGLFACLFGLGVSQQWRRWEAAGDDVAARHGRRMLFLLAIGLVHAVFIRNGDILVPYALLGLILLAFRRVSSPVLAIAAVILFTLPYAVPFVRSSYGLSWPSRPTGVTGNYVLENVSWLAYWYQTNPFIAWPRILTLMIAGVLLGRARVVERLAADRAFAAKVLAGAMLLAVVSRAVFEQLALAPVQAATGPLRAVGLNFVYHVSSWTLAATYAALLLLVMQRRAVTVALWPLRALGRMAFTNYLGQGLIVVPVCLIFGLFDNVAPLRGVAIAAGVALVQMLFSAWWLSRHSTGPFERLWRAVTYGGRRITIAQPVL